tara:strand:+ start:3005 stop:4960 length:1956 start_codon:yes stop_codon:yes gene_type:complete
MCGITGFFGSNLKKDISIDILKKMNSNLHHRGPDDEGYWFDEKEGLYFGHKRLSIIDLSKKGQQPMESSNKNYIICYNGEIYNFQKIKDKLIKEFNISFQGKSDTEILLEAINFYGLKKTLSIINGMYAFALWDKQNKKLFLCRDRFGEKPIYYYLSQKEVMFSSEIKSLLVNPNFEKNLNTLSVQSYIKYGFVGGFDSIFNSTKKIKPGHFVEFKFDKLNNLIDNEYCYWNPIDVAREAKQNQEHSENVVLEKLEKKLNDSVSERIIADVNLGSFLSGGIDSSLISSIMKQVSPNKINTFTVKTEDKRFDESINAKKIANHLGTNHEEILIDEKKSVEIIKELPFIYDEPFADSSQIPTMLISNLLKENNVKVTLTGDGGDEIFGGYNRYVWGPRVLAIFKVFNQENRKRLSKIISFLKTNAWDSFGIYYNKLVANKYKVENFGYKIHKLADILKKIDEQDAYNEIVSVYSNPEGIISRDLEKVQQFQQIKIDGFTNKESMMLNDISNYLIFDILTKVDRATMSQSVESRIPFLDKEIFKFSWTIPDELKIKGGITKYPLRKLLRKYLPESLLNQPKMGFAIPLDNWLRGSLKNWAEEQLDIKQLKSDWMFKPSEINRLWNEHQNFKANNSYKLWNIIMIKSWLSYYKLG